MRRALRSVALALACGVMLQRGLAESEFIFPPGPQSQRDHHASTVVELKNGDVLSAWFAGSKEGAPDVAIWSARLSHGVWSAPMVVAQKQGVACWNPVLFHTHDGRLWLYYKFGTHPSTWVGARRWSDDEGRTWSAEQLLPEGILGPIRAKPLLLPGSVVLSGSSVERAGEWRAWIERSTDDGRSFNKIGPITVPDALDVPDDGARAAAERDRTADDGATKHYPPAASTIGIIQPVLVALGPHHIRLYARSHTRAARIAVADSEDDGQSWTQAHYLDLPNPNSGIDALRLADGRVVLLFNNSYDTRTPLVLAVSRDGEHFHIFATVEDGPGQYSYPALVQAQNGDLLMTYTYRRETIKYVRLPLAQVPEPK
ncbi:MAG: exo-alpha-sialidase [Acidobacteriota bacterium]|nr:exo-alpha-sialidase [Acidobacteriota bacterium]